MDEENPQLSNSNNQEDDYDVEQSRNSDLLQDSFALPSDFPALVDENSELPSKNIQAEDLMDNYGSLLSGQPRLRKICEDQEIYEVEGVNVDLETLQAVKMRSLSTESAEICVEPTIKFPHEYQDESSMAAASIAFEMQEDDSSKSEEFISTLPLQEFHVFKPLTNTFGETQSPESSCGTLSPEQEIISPKIPKIKNNLDFPWTPLFEKRHETTSPAAAEAGDSSHKAVSKVRFREQGKHTEFVIPAAPGQTPFHRIGEAGRKSPYRVTPHPSTGRTVMPSALMGKGQPVNSVGQSPSLKGTDQADLNTTPQQDMRRFAMSPLIGECSGSFTGGSPEDEPGPVPRVPNNTPVEGVPLRTTSFSSIQLEEFWGESMEKSEDEGSQANRQQHNMKERVRRQRIKVSCDRLRTLIPGMTEKTDKATVFEFAAHYIAYLRSLLDHEYSPAYDKDFLKKATRLIAEEPI